jgi:putative transposase
VQLTQKIRIYPTSDQQKLLWVLAEKCRLIYNFALKARQDHWNRMKSVPILDRTVLSYQEQQNQLPTLKATYPEYRWVYSKVLQMTLKKLDADYKSFYALSKTDPTARPPRFKGKQYFTTLCYNQSGFGINDRTITFSHKHPSKTLLRFDLPYRPPTDVKQVELFVDRHVRWFVALTYNLSPPPYFDNGRYQAIDLGVINIVSAVNVQGKTIQIKNRRADLYWKKPLEEVQSKRDHCTRKSRQWNRYHAKYCYMKRKCANQLRDFQHQTSHKIVTHTKANTIILGDLDVKAMARHVNTKGSLPQTKARKTLHHSIQNTGSLGRFVQFVTYKAEKIGKKVIQIDEAFTTQVCAKCGEKVKRALSERFIECACGHRMDRDLNSAINLLVKFLLALSHEPSVNEDAFLREWTGIATIHSPIRIRSNRSLVGSPAI